MDGIKLLRLVLGDFQHLDRQNAEMVFFELFNDVADCVSAHGIWLNNRESALQSFHNFVRLCAVVRRGFSLRSQVFSAPPAVKSF